MTESGPAPRAPVGLAAAGRRLWRALHAVDEEGRRLIFTASEVVLVEEACRFADDVARIRGELEGRSLIVEGSRGQDTVDPLRGELRQSVARLESLLRSVEIPDEAVEEASAATWAGRRLARARWT